MKAASIHYRPTFFWLLLSVVMIIASINNGLAQTSGATGKNIEAYGVPTIPVSLERGVEA